MRETAPPPRFAPPVASVRRVPAVIVSALEGPKTPAASAESVPPPIVVAPV